MTTETEFTEDEVARHCEMFPDGAPDVAIGGLDIVRATVVASERHQGVEPEVSWTVTGFSNEDYYPFVLMGDLRCRGNGWFIGASAVCFLSFRDMSLKIAADDYEAINELITRYGPWASHALYDVVAMRARTLAASTLGCKLEVPAQTPTAQLELAPEKSGVSSDADRSTR